MIKSIIKKNHCKNKISNGKKNVSFRRFVSDKYIYTVNDSNEDTFICNGNKNDECDISTYLDERKLEDIDEVLMVDLQMLNDPLIEDIVETFIISKTLIKKVLAFNFHGNIKNSRYALSEENLKNIAEKLKYSKRKAFKEVEITLCMILKHHIRFFNIL
ncbi:Hypothetical protein SRAE_0000069700 [Strongyloides ratti]|uniref:Uncharacterized protein n=1 Tax=Strongyloides ratti TaxID=34506 RepID=A0A090L272_STRRB|nr:Hypothetical protein SRAE_0000069700 [Strongyloides ratti]CEF61579.1 Hypothetical protein SRAE_0000069700 [Strongyloides ratti]